MRRILLAAALAASLSGCAGVGGPGFGSGYSLIRAREHAVGDHTLIVTPAQEWNRQSTIIFDDIRQVEDWTQNGPVLDSLSFVSGLKDGKSIVRQWRKADQQVPRFRSSMTAPEVAAMLETFYRTRAGTLEFKTLALAPRPFLGGNGFQLDFDHLDGDELWRRGRAVGAVVDGRLYLILLDAARSHYFNTELPEFENVVRSAHLRR
ncbi:MAG: hypothetical protein ABR588_12425 [Sphingomicrobium sp.]|nr:hypothetical protein [Sphingomonadales bacterium]